MDQKIDEFSVKAAMDYAKSSDGKAIFAALNAKHSGEIQKIRQMMSSGDLNGAKEAISKLINSSEEIRNRMPKERL